MIDEDEAPNSELLRHATTVQSNTEALEHLRHNCSQRTRLTINTSKSLADFAAAPHCRINPESLLKMLTQLAYFLYSCRQHGLTPLIQQKADIKVEQISGLSSRQEKKVLLVIWYKLEEGKMPENMGAETFQKVMKQLLEQWRSYIANRDHKEDLASETELERQVDMFFDQIAALCGKEIYLSNEIAFFMGVEKADIFYNHSLLYRIKHCSLMDFIKTNDQRMELFKKSKNRDEGLVVDYHKEKSRNKSEQELSKVKDKQREIEENLESFFRAINTQGFEIGKKVDKEQGSKVRFTFNLTQRPRLPFEQALEEMEGTGMKNQRKADEKIWRPLGEMNFQVEYSSDGNQISVKLIMPNIRVSIENSDFLMFQSNVLTFDAVNVSIELCPYADKQFEKTGKPNQEPPRVVAFKGISSFPVKEPPLEKILLLMDLTMIASKVYEPELTMSKATTHKDYKRLFNLSKQINHYTKMFMRCAKKVYE